MKQTDIYDSGDFLILQNCTLCPRDCGVNRFNTGSGFCASDAGLNVASVCIHRGEEPIISGTKGICNVFFSGCNMRCIFCQNHEISYSRSGSRYASQDLDSVLDQIGGILSTGVKTLGFVSPSHMIPQVKAIIKGVNSRGFNPIKVYNTNSYDKASALRGLEGMIDVYLPDFKYVTTSLAIRYSSSPDYPVVALKALKEMYYQKGSVMQTDEEGTALSGMLIRHLVLPGHAEESKMVLRTIAEELSPGVHLSLMSQYHPEGNLEKYPELNRTLYKDEYESVVEEMNSLGFRNGYVQEIDSSKNYRPDFSRDKPFD